MAEEDRGRNTNVKMCFWVLCRPYQGVADELSHAKLAWHSNFTIHSACFFAFTTHWLCSAGSSESTSHASFLFSFCSVYLSILSLLALSVLFTLYWLVWNNETASATAVNYAVCIWGMFASLKVALNCETILCQSRTDTSWLIGIAFRNYVIALNSTHSVTCYSFTLLTCHLHLISSMQVHPM